MSMDRELYLLMCQLLAESRAKAPTELDQHQDRWSRLIYIANEHFAAPMLFDALRRRDLLAHLPQDIQQYLSAIRNANAERNDAIRRQIAEFLPALNAASIEPILLKGSAFLIGDPKYGDARMMFDIDFLVPGGAEEAAWQAMSSIGYYARKDEDSARSHQMSALTCDGAVAAVEIHRSIGPQRTLLSVDEAYAASSSINMGGHRCRLMAPEHRALHCLFNGQVQDFHYWFARPQLRTLLDLCRLNSTCPDIDWQKLAGLFRDQGYGAVVNSTLALMNAWLDFSMPAGVPITRRDLRYVARCARGIEIARRETSARQRWIGWAAKNLLPSRLAFSLALEDRNRATRLSVIVPRQVMYLLRLTTWPVRRAAYIKRFVRRTRRTRRTPR